MEKWCKHNQNIAGEYHRCNMCNPRKGLADGQSIKVKITRVIINSGEAYEVKDNIVGTRIFGDMIDVTEYLLKLSGGLDDDHTLQIVER